MAVNQEAVLEDYMEKKEDFHSKKVLEMLGMQIKKKLDNDFK